MRIVDTRGPLNVPFDHPLVAENTNAALREADVLLLVDVDVPWIPRQVTPSTGTRIAQLDIDPLKESIALVGFPVDLPIQADSTRPYLSCSRRRAARVGDGPGTLGSAARSIR